MKEYKTKKERLMDIREAEYLSQKEKASFEGDLLSKFEQLQKLQAEIDALEKFRDKHTTNSWFGAPVPPSEQIKYQEAYNKIKINRNKMREILLGYATTS